MSILVIVESPSKCKKIENYLGSSYKVVASCGHITSFHSLDQINLDTYEINYKIEKPKIVSMLKTEIKKASKVIIATDDDREGEAIGWHICKLCKLNIETTPRLLFHEITKEALQYGIHNLSTLNMNRIHSQQTRQLLDLYIGFKISPVLWKYIKNKLSAGRCQTPALHMLYEKEKEYEKQKSDTHFKVEGLFTKENIKFHLSKHLNTEMNEFLNLCKIYAFHINKTEKHSHIEKRPTILITSTLQQKAHQNLGFSPIQTMSYAQTLYENGYITYMRTDTPSYNDIFKEQLKQYIIKKHGQEYYKEIPIATKKAHEGIRVTDLNVTEINNMGNNAIHSLYRFIYKHTLQTSMSDSTIETTHHIINAPLDNCFVYKEPRVLFEGWKKETNKKETIYYGDYLSKLKDIQMNYISCKEVKHSPVYHYCEAQLIQKMEKENIGRPSTYASILSKLYDKHYIIKGKIKSPEFNMTTYILENNNIQKKCELFSVEETNKISVTELGKKVAEFCYTYYNHLFEYEYTKKMETKLDEIEENGLWKNIFEDFKKDVDKEVHITTLKTPQVSLHCGLYKKKPVIIKKGPYGFYMEYNKKKSSLLHWEHYDKLSDYIEEQCFPNEYIESIVNFNKDCNKDYSIRNGKYGDYVYYKTPSMKKPMFYKLDIESRNIEDIKEYMEKKYSIIL